MKLASQLLPGNPHAKRILPNTFQRSDDLARFLPSAPRLIVFTLRRLHSQILALCFHNLTNPFSRNLFIFTSIQNPGGAGVRPRSQLRVRCASVANPMFSAVCRLFVVSLRSFLHLLPLFSIACGLFFQNTPGGGGSVRHRIQATKPARVPRVPIPT